MPLGLPVAAWGALPEAEGADYLVPSAEAGGTFAHQLSCCWSHSRCTSEKGASLRSTSCDITSSIDRQLDKDNSTATTRSTTALLFSDTSATTRSQLLVPCQLSRACAPAPLPTLVWWVWLARSRCPLTSFNYVKLH